MGVEVDPEESRLHEDGRHRERHARCADKVFGNHFEVPRFVFDLILLELTTILFVC